MSVINWIEGMLEGTTKEVNTFWKKALIDSLLAEVVSYYNMVLRLRNMNHWIILCRIKTLMRAVTQPNANDSPNFHRTQAWWILLYFIKALT
jgi:hypothetical protein